MVLKEMSCCQIRLLLSCSIGPRRQKNSSFRKNLSLSWLSQQSKTSHEDEFSDEISPPAYPVAISTKQLQPLSTTISTAPLSFITRNSTQPTTKSSHQSDKLRNKTVLAVGADRGLGREAALSFANAGARVICVAFNQADIDAVVSEIQARYPHAPSALAITSDFAQPDAASTVLATVQSHLGSSGGIDILVTNTGIIRPIADVVEPNSTLDDWWSVLEINLRGTVSFVRAVLPRMRARRSGVLVSLTSASEGQDISFASAYATSDAAVTKFNQELGVELEGSGVHCFTVHPGSVATDLAASKIVKLCTDERMTCLNGKCVDVQQDFEEILRDVEKKEESRIIKNGLVK